MLQLTRDKHALCLMLLAKKRAHKNSIMMALRKEKKLEGRRKQQQIDVIRVYG
jgi:hypothetical protein